MINRTVVRLTVLTLLFSGVYGCYVRPSPAGPWPTTSQPVRPPAAPPISGSVSDATTVRGKTILGYQGWFACPDDKTGQRGWGHWAGNGAPAIDIVPDTSEFPQQPGCRAPFIRDAQGQPVMLYSAQNPQTVDVQFKWLQQYGISGVALQRFVGELANPAAKASRDQVLANVQQAAERHGRVFFLTYDISGGRADWADALKRDWQSLVAAHVTDSPAYLHDHGKPVVEVWGIGFSDRPAQPDVTLELMEFFSKSPDPKMQASVMAGVPVNWRDQTQRQGGKPSWLDVYRLASSISPWFIGAFTDPASERMLIERRISEDVSFTRTTGQVYLPVIYPGFSSFNQSQMHQKFEPRPRACGEFLTMQTDALLKLGIDSFYVAMFDEANEGTAVFKARLEPFVSPSGEAKFMDADPACANEGSLYLRLLGSLSAKLPSAH